MNAPLSGGLGQFAFAATTDADGPAIDLSWRTSPGDPTPERRVTRILRRERRFPGAGRRGFLQVQAAATDLADGALVYDASAFSVDREDSRVEQEASGPVRVRRQFRYVGAPPDPVLVRVIREQLASDMSTPLSYSVQVVDRAGLAEGVIYYYTGFIDAGLPQPVFSRATQAAALVTATYGYDLFRQLPQIDQRLDVATPPPGGALADAAKGQLQRFVDGVTAHVNMLHGQIGAMSALHDPRRVDSRMLQPMADWLGWTLKQYLDEDGQRTEIGFASEVYRSVGASPNIAAQVNRLTGWATQIKEFVRNIVVSVDTSRYETLAAGEILPPGAGVKAYLDGGLACSPTFAAWLDLPLGAMPGPPYLVGRSQPPGSVDTTDVTAMFKLRNGALDDAVSRSYDCGAPDGLGGYVQTNDTRYNRGTIGVFIVPLAETTPFVLQQEWQRVKGILDAFFPINVRAIFVVQPDVVVETAYDATTEASDSDIDVLLELAADIYTDLPDADIDRIPEWIWLISNRIDLVSVNTATLPVYTDTRVWHTDITKP
jgi:phage tail-like protein